MSKLGAHFASAKVGQPQTHRNLTIYPLYVQNGHERLYRTLDEALSAEEVVIQEVSERGSVPSLTVRNTGKLPVLIVVGEELIGSKQNRVLNISLLVPAESQLQIPVSCVEQGRWSYSSRTFGTSGTLSHYRLRKLQTEKVTRSLHTTGRVDADQGAVWGEVTRKLGSTGTLSATGALHDVYKQTEDRVKEYLSALHPPAAEGILVAINGHMVGADLFDHAATLRALWDKLARSYAVDALEREAQESAPGAPDPQQFLAQVGTAAEESYDSVGIGKDLRLSGETISGSGLLWEGRIVHASVFSKTHTDHGPDFMGPERDFVQFIGRDFQEGIPVWGAARFSPGLNLLLQVQGTSHQFIFDAQNVQELTLGRKNPDSTETPDVDLTPYGAQEKGVSRQHAAIIQRDGNLNIVDKGSQNGTYLNGQRLVADQPRILRDGDDLRLGHLVLTIKFERP